MWTDIEKQMLVQLYPYHTDAELCETLNKTRGQVRGMKERLGLHVKQNKFSDDEIESVKLFYESNPNEMDLEKFARAIGRPKTSISRIARSLGLTNYHRGNTESEINKTIEKIKNYHETEKYRTEIYPLQVSTLAYYARNNHPRGMLGKHHSEDTKKKMSASQMSLWNSYSPEEYEHRVNSLRSAIKNGKAHESTQFTFSRGRGGFRTDLGIYVRSSWEANIARVFNYLGILWNYEYRRFKFSDVGDGVLSYCPDFYLAGNDIWVEVKGWMDEKSIIRLSKMREYYPEEYSKLYLIDEQEYLNIKKEYANKIAEWE